jgi:hypothetical protein
MRIAGRATIVSAVIAISSLVGCSGQGSGDYARVSGVVTLNGDPVEGAKVTFVSTTEASGTRSEYATTTDSSGKYMIAAVGKNPGIPAGMYKVLVTKLVPKSGAKIPEDFDMTQLEMSGLGVNTLPKEYADFGTTKFSATLEPGKNENVNFDLKGK